MTVGVKGFRGKRLQEARLARGLFKNALGDMIGVSGTAITRYEDGLDCPVSERLELLADKLNFPIDFFTKSPWEEDIDTVFWRSRSTETKSAREMTEQRMRWLCEIFSFLETEVDFPEFELPESELPNDFRTLTGAMIERIAQNVRESWGLRDQPVPDMLLALENAGIGVSAFEIPSDKQDGFCFKSELLGRYLVGINIDGASAARARLDAGHELGHIILHRRVTREQRREPLGHKILESQAFRFAGALLFPRDAFVREVGTVSLDYFSALKKRWGISIAAMINRALDLELINKDTRTWLFREMTIRRWRGHGREPFDSEMPLERPRMLRRGIEAVLQGGIFAKSTIRAALALPVREIEALTGLAAGALNGDPIVDSPAVSLRRPGMAAVDLESGNVLEFPRRNQNDR
jgi:Zn-dependent peptidase ImmA (M78 family)/DNA-binding XRE family transcriptional regulator